MALERKRDDFILSLKIEFGYAIVLLNINQVKDLSPTLVSLRL